MGDGRTYANLVGVRAITSEDGMTADWARLPHALLERISYAHRQRSAGRQPRRLRHHVETAGHRRVGIAACASSSSAAVRAKTRSRGGSRSRRRARRSFTRPATPAPRTRGETSRSVAATDGAIARPREGRTRSTWSSLGPETAIAAGVGDRLRDAGICRSSDRTARAGGSSRARSSPSASWSGTAIPTARFAVVHSLDAARKALEPAGPAAWS